MDDVINKPKRLSGRASGARFLGWLPLKKCAILHEIMGRGKDAGSDQSGCADYHEDVLTCGCRGPLNVASHISEEEIETDAQLFPSRYFKKSRSSSVSSSLRET
jgi:hypothetical protein